MNKIQLIRFGRVMRLPWAAALVLPPAQAQPIITVQLTNKTSQSSAFTRCDLLACVAVAALLSALAAAGISSSTDNTNRIICNSNLRQLGSAHIMYASDNRDYIAFANWDAGSASSDPPGTPGWLYQATTSRGINGGNIPNPFSPSYTNTPGGAWESGAWWPYVRNQNAYLCPVDIQSPTYSKNERNNELSSYVMNGAAVFYAEGPNASGPPWKTCRISDVWSPNCYLLWNPDENSLGPENPGAFEFNDGSNVPEYPVEALAVFHGRNGADVATVSGSVTFVLTSAFQNAELYPLVQPGLAWWSPLTYNGH